MRLVIVTAVMLGAAWTFASAADGEQALETWVSGMMRRVPFTDGVFDRQALIRQSQGYLDGLVTHYREIGERPRRRAEEAGNAFRVHEIDDRTEQMIGKARRYVEATTSGMAATVDPEGTGHVTAQEARGRLLVLARAADANRDGFLGEYEAMIAEAAFARGVDLSKPGTEAALQREFEDAKASWDWR